MNLVFNILRKETINIKSEDFKDLVLSSMYLKN